ncbi:response regulator [Pseudovibrio sp. Ad26]|uniref:response regulator transcription factor n=1 Tax=Pseudovibrio sp. Ad26 TaxID=989410 RepID=UPI0007AE7855|nr:response regulator [Pseudovibrio sp. Ad26]KZL03169.1 Response regulator protein TmoT [Pseudovibrio sp. Ad26]
MTYPVYLVDDDKAVREALSLLLSTVGINVTSFADPQAFLARVDDLAPGCLILDIRMPAISGLKIQEKLAERGVGLPTVVISGHGDIDACRRAFRNGAVDFLSKPIDEQDLIDAIQKGSEVLDQQLLSAAEKSESRALLALLTMREREVLNSVAEGFTTRQIAEGLGLSPRTIESHRAAIGGKLGTTSQAELTRIWLDGRDTP